MRIGLVQMPVVDNLAINMESARAGAVAAAAEGAKVVVLPEMFCCPYSCENFTRYAEPEGGAIHSKLAQMATEAGVYLIAGSVPEAEIVGTAIKRYNTSYVFSPTGEQLAKHRKVHLFDVTIPGKVHFKESDTLEAGDGSTTFNTPWLKIGVTICYDLRFPELFRKITLEGAQLIVVPAAFNTTTGEAHWELLARSRAVDNQVFIALCSPASIPTDHYVAYGHSLVSNSWGDIIGQLSRAPGLLVVDIDLEHLKGVRAQLPLLQHRRQELY